MVPLVRGCTYCWEVQTVVWIQKKVLLNKGFEIFAFHLPLLCSVSYHQHRPALLADFFWCIISGKVVTVLCLRTDKSGMSPSYLLSCFVFSFLYKHSMMG